MQIKVLLKYINKYTNTEFILYKMNEVFKVLFFILKS